MTFTIYTKSGCFKCRENVGLALHYTTITTWNENLISREKKGKKKLTSFMYECEAENVLVSFSFFIVLLLCK